MKDYEKDEINFHSIVSAMRRMRNVTLEQLGDGLYSSSMMKLIEKGNRLPEKLMRDRIMSRMGVSEENYEDYLQPDEYKHWCIRQEILSCVEYKKLDKLEQYLNEYADLEKYCVVEQQFYETIRFWFYKQINASLKQQQETIEKAVLFTMPKIKEGFPKRMLLSEQELKLLTEYIALREYKGAPEYEFEWRIQQYEIILGYVEQSKIDDIGKAKIYPKIAYYYNNLILSINKTEKYVHQGMRVCNRAIELLRNEHKLYYFVELLEQREKLIEWMMKYFAEKGQNKNADKLRSLLEETTMWKDVIKELYLENGILPYMQNDCHIYWERNSSAIGDVITVRREMLGMTREQLCSGICDKRTLMRIELKQKRTQMPIVRQLFERLGLCAEYIRGRVITADVEVLHLTEKLGGYFNDYEMEKCEDILRKLENQICLDIKYNRQVIAYMWSLLKMQKKEISHEEFMEQILTALEHTISLDAIMNADKVYLTKQETICMYNIAINLNADFENPYVPILERICDNHTKENRIPAYLSMYELILTGLASLLGNKGDYQKSDSIGTKMLREALRYRRLGALSSNLYNNVWNYKQRIMKNMLIECVYDVKKELNRCIILSRIAKRKNLQKFYKQQLLEEY